MFKKREDKIKKLLLIKGVKLVCIAIEGPDCIGKVRLLRTYINI